MSYGSSNLIQLEKTIKTFKLPGILKLQPRGVSYSDNKSIEKFSQRYLAMDGAYKTNICPQTFEHQF